jgi:hypothetical protein
MIEPVAKILKIFHNNGLFDEGVELIGSWCFHLYQKHLGVKYFPLRTQDIDFLIPYPYKGKEHKEFLGQLEEIGFRCDFNTDGSLFLWNAEMKIEFIIPQKGCSSNQSIKVNELGFNAMPLRFVNLLLEKPIVIKDDDISIRVPNPVNFCIHKLIIASRRKKADKELKDIQQAICTSIILDTREIQSLFKTLPKGWKNSVLIILDKAKEVLPLMSEEVGKLKITLQNVNK